MKEGAGMKKRYWLAAAGAALVVLAVLFIPVPQASYDDGGTREYTALTYKVVAWNRLTSEGVYDRTRVYFLGDRWKTIDELWEKEKESLENRFRAVVKEINGSTALVEPMETEEERQSSDRISFGTAGLEDIGAGVGTVVEITYTGGIMESYPAQIRATGWRIAGDQRPLTYTDRWLNKTTAEKWEEQLSSDLRITRIYADCFFAQPVIPMPYEVKINGILSDSWCPGDQVLCRCENVYYDQETDRMEADLLSIEVSSFKLDQNVAYKPVIYLYPEEETEVSVRLQLNGALTCTYPAYGEGWRVTAAPDGTLTDTAGQTYNYLYWEGELRARYEFSKGFCVRGEDTAAFLETALTRLGLTRREANEFIVYWLPRMEQNPYNIIAFQTDAYTEAARLEIDPAPDTLIRVFMTWQPAGESVEMEPQELTAPERRGFTVVEWGGARIEK